MPSLTASGLSAMAPLPAPTPNPVQAAAVQLAVAQPAAALSLTTKPRAMRPAVPSAAVPALPASAAAPAQPRALAEKIKPAAAAPDEASGAADDAGRVLFDQGAASGREAVPGTPKPSGFDRRGPGKVIDPGLLPGEIYSAEIMQVAREHGLVFEADAASLRRMKPGVTHNYVIVQNPDGTIAMTVGRVVPGNTREMGVKHAALGGGRAVLFAGEVRINPVSGRPRIDFNSGTFSQVGLDPRWKPTLANARDLAAHAETILGIAVDIYDHIQKRPIKIRGVADGFFERSDDATIARQFADKPSPLRQMQLSLEARGQGAVFKEAEAILYTDGLMGLPNRAFIMEKAESLLAGVKEPTVAMLDMNNFGAVNAGLADVHGPVAGKEMGDRMLATAGPKIDAIARMAGVRLAGRRLARMSGSAPPRPDESIFGATTGEAHNKLQRAGKTGLDADRE